MEGIVTPLISKARRPPAGPRGLGERVGPLCSDGDVATRDTHALGLRLYGCRRRRLDDYRAAVDGHDPFVAFCILLFDLIAVAACDQREVTPSMILTQSASAQRVFQRHIGAAP